MRMIKGKTYYTKPWYNSYRCMHSRCYRRKDPSYKHYGGRGIVVCDEWHNIENFEKWVETHPYKIGMTLDRIDPNGNYEPKNCRWATMFEQDNNRRNSILIEYNGETHSISEWAIKLGINRSTLNNRYYRGDRGAKLFRRTENNHGKKGTKNENKWRSVPRFAKGHIGGKKNDGDNH